MPGPISKQKRVTEKAKAQEIGRGWAEIKEDGANWVEMQKIGGAWAAMKEGRANWAEVREIRGAWASMKRK